MAHYYFNKNTDDKGRHEVHTSDCSYLPSEANREYIGNYLNCSEAIKAAKIRNIFKDFDGCYWCSKPCHRG